MGDSWDPTIDPCDALHNGSFFRNEAEIVACSPTPKAELAPRVVSKDMECLMQRLKALKEASRAPEHVLNASDNTSDSKSSVASALSNACGGNVSLIQRSAAAALSALSALSEKENGESKDKSVKALAVVAVGAAAAVASAEQAKEAAMDLAEREQLVRLVAAERVRLEAIAEAEARIKKEHSVLQKRTLELDARSAEDRAAFQARKEKLEARIAREHRALKTKAADLAQKSAALDARCVDLDRLTKSASVSLTRERAILDERREAAVQHEADTRALLARERTALDQLPACLLRKALTSLSPEPPAPASRRAPVHCPMPGTPPPEEFVELSPGPLSPPPKLRNSTRRKGRARPLRVPTPLRTASPLNPESGALVVRRSTPARKSEAEKLLESLAYTPWSDGPAGSTSQGSLTRRSERRARRRKEDSALVASTPRPSKRKREAITPTAKALLPALSSPGLSTGKTAQDRSKKSDDKDDDLGGRVALTAHEYHENIETAWMVMNLGVWISVSGCAVLALFTQEEKIYCYALGTTSFVLLETCISPLQRKMTPANEEDAQKNEVPYWLRLRKITLWIEFTLSFLVAVIGLWATYAISLLKLSDQYSKNIIYADVQARVTFFMFQFGVVLVSLVGTICLVCFTVQVVAVSRSRNSDPLELLYLATNPKKFTRAVSLGLQNQAVPSPRVRKILILLISLASFFEILFNVFRNALWLTVTGISSYTRYLPVNVTTRAATIIKRWNKTRKHQKELALFKGDIILNITHEDRVAEQKAVSMNYPTVHHYVSAIPVRADKCWYHWNEIEYETRFFRDVQDVRVSTGILGESTPGAYTNSLGDRKGCLLDTGDCVAVRECANDVSTLSLTTSNGKQVCIALSTSQVTNFVQWAWQHSTDTVYGALEGTDGCHVNRDTVEMDVLLVLFSFFVKCFIHRIYGLETYTPSGRGENSADLAMLRLAILGAMLTVREVYIRPWVKMRTKRVQTEQCSVLVHTAGCDQLSSALRRARDCNPDRQCPSIPPKFLRNTHELLFLNDEWGVDFYSGHDSCV